jgi:hypothetical protein
MSWNRSGLLLNRATAPAERESAPVAQRLLCWRTEVGMRYIVAWVLGVPFSVIVLWYIVGHAACGH